MIWDGQNCTVCQGEIDIIIIICHFGKVLFIFFEAAELHPGMALVEGYEPNPVGDSELRCSVLVIPIVHLNSPALGKCNRIAHLDPVFHNLGHSSRIIILLYCLKHSLNSFYIAAQPPAFRLKPLNALLVLAQLLPHLVQVCAGNC